MATSKRPDTAKIYTAQEAQLGSALGLSAIWEWDGQTHAAWFEPEAEETVSGGLGRVVTSRTEIRIESPEPIEVRPGDIVLDQDGNAWEVSATGKPFKTGGKNHSVSVLCHSVALPPPGVA